jgi:hypothetical protein
MIHIPNIGEAVKASWGRSVAEAINGISHRLLPENPGVGHTVIYNGTAWVSAPGLPMLVSQDNIPRWNGSVWVASPGLPANPAAGQVAMWNGSNWVSAPGLPTAAAAGAMLQWNGAAWAPVAGLPTARVQGQTVTWDGTNWVMSPNAGPPGPAGTIQIGTVTTGPPGSAAVVKNVGTPSAAVLDFVIPQGPPGIGSQGPPGAASTVPGPPGPAGPQTYRRGITTAFSIASGSYKDFTIDIGGGLPQYPTMFLTCFEINGKDTVTAAVKAGWNGGNLVPCQARNIGPSGETIRVMWMAIWGGV